ncbi:MAG: hypothetical protein QNJ46_20520 [Leptolyngbyaceae cyanobacterium MO_188.B28]|nr:hypothetical protein [Leptolyngbyaceae cyanobacterium MO_188.B28]
MGRWVKVICIGFLFSQASIQITRHSPDGWRPTPWYAAHILAFETSDRLGAPNLCLELRRVPLAEAHCRDSV